MPLEQVIPERLVRVALPKLLALLILLNPMLPAPTLLDPWLQPLIVLEATELLPNKLEMRRLSSAWLAESTLPLLMVLPPVGILEKRLLIGLLKNGSELVPAVGTELC